MTKEMVQAVKDERAALVAKVRQIDAFLALFGIGVAAPVAGKGKRKETSADASARARKAWATKKRKAAAQAKAEQTNGASILEAVS